MNPVRVERVLRFGAWLLAAVCVVALLVLFTIASLGCSPPQSAQVQVLSESNNRLTITNQSLVRRVEQAEARAVEAEARPIESWRLETLTALKQIPAQLTRWNDDEVQRWTETREGATAAWKYITGGGGLMGVGALGMWGGLRVREKRRANGA